MALQSIYLSSSNTLLYLFFLVKNTIHTYANTHKHARKHVSMRIFERLSQYLSVEPSLSVNNYASCSSTVLPFAVFVLQIVEFTIWSVMNTCDHRPMIRTIAQPQSISLEVKPLEHGFGVPGCPPRSARASASFQQRGCLAESPRSAEAAHPHGHTGTA